MSNDKLFTVAGTATHKGVTKVRFANDLVARIKILAKAGATDVNLVELPQAMTKLQALKYLQEQGFDGEFDLQRRAQEVPVHEYIALAQQLP
jgi:hypothetical protein